MVTGQGFIGQLFQPFQVGHDFFSPHTAQQRRSRALWLKAETRSSCTGQQLTRGAPQLHIGGRQLFADALNGQSGHVVCHRRQLPRRQLHLAGDVLTQGVQGCAPQIHTRSQRTFHPHIKPALYGAGYKLIRHPINQQAWQQPHQRKHRHQLGQQLAAEFFAPKPQQQAQQGPSDHAEQNERHHHIEAQQAGVIDFVQRPVVGGGGEHEQQHQRQARHEGQCSHQHPTPPHHTPGRTRSRLCFPCLVGTRLRGKG